VAGIETDHRQTVRGHARAFYEATFADLSESKVDCLIPMPLNLDL